MAVGRWALCGNVLTGVVSGSSFVPDGCVEVETARIEFSSNCQRLLETNLASTCPSLPDASGPAAGWDRVPDRDP